MNWRSWLYTRITTDVGVLALLPVGSVFAAGSMEGREDTRPFVVVRLGSNTAELNDADEPYVTNQEAAIWVHDEPGSYKRIDDTLAALRAALAGQVNEAIAAIWQGDSPELSDPDQGTIVRYSSYRLYGRAV